MGVRIALLRGINLGPRNRVAMPALAQALQEQGFAPVRTYLQSGNVVLASELREAALADAVKSAVLERFEIDIDVLVRSREEFAAVVSNNPLAAVATDPKRFQVSFLARELDNATLERLRGLAAESERLEAQGRELYAWHPNGVARSKLWAGLAARTLGVPATARNWSTVESLLALADEHADGG
ncbi:MAG TPA: DUF1697 domain-containing protein [Solirubrobacteraceae bacterium]|jgi:uncharacterized protein (DUF1697 family)|nr:DUF1697 domain-containing protein [Solirubrobacteraceae bacterium]